MAGTMIFYGVYGGFPKTSSTFWGGPYHKDYSLLGSILGSPYSGNYHFAEPYLC